MAVSFAEPLLTSEVNALGPLRLLEALRRAAPQARFFQASSGQMFGDATEKPQRETTPFRPRTAYAVAKLFAHGMTATYRQAQGDSAPGVSVLHAGVGMLTQPLGC